MVEIYKDIEGYEQLYQISNLGNVKSFQTGKEKILKPNKTKKGYLRIELWKQGKYKKYLVHRLVAQHFIDNPNNYEQINHRDEDKTNNCVSNLEYCDCKYNINYGTRNQRAAVICTNNPKRSKQVLCLETGIIYPSTMEVQRQTGFSQGYISLACRGKVKTAYNYTWKYVS